ncbi:WASH complex subunit [Dirofilaria immitis]
MKGKIGRRMISERKILIFIAINILAVAIVVDTLPYGYARPPSVKVEERKPYKVVTTRKPYVPPPIIEPRDRGYEGVGRNGGGRRISYSRRSYK